MRCPYNGNRMAMPKRLFWILSGGCARGLLAHQSPLARSVAPLRTSQVVLGWAKIYFVSRFARVIVLACPSKIQNSL